MTTKLDQLRRDALDLSAKSYEAAFGEHGVILAAEAGATGSVNSAAEHLSARDRALLGVGCLAGAAGAMSRIAFPFDESPEETLTRVDFALELARANLIRDRNGDRLLFDELPDLSENED